MNVSWSTNEHFFFLWGELVKVRRKGDEIDGLIYIYWNSSTKKDLFQNLKYNWIIYIFFNSINLSIFWYTFLLRWRQWFFCSLTMGWKSTRKSRWCWVILNINIHSLIFLEMKLKDWIPRRTSFTFLCFWNMAR